MPDANRNQSTGAGNKPAPVSISAGPPSPAGRTPADWKIFCGLLFLSALLRVVRINQGLGYDEIFSLDFFFRSPLSEIVTRMPWPNNHPLYSALAHACILVFGEPEWALRLPAFITGSLTPPLLYLLGRRLFNPAAAALAGLLFAVGFWPLWQSADARGYAPMMFFSLLATHEFLRLADRFSAGRAAGFVAAAVAATYSHLYGGFVIIGCGAAALAMLPSRRGDGLRLTLLCLAAGLAAGALYLPFLPDLRRFNATRGRAIYEAGNTVTAGLVREVFFDWPLGPYRRLWSAPLCALAALGLIPAWRQARRWLAVWGVSLAAGFAVPLAASSFVFARFYSFGLPGFFLLAAAGTVLVWERLDRTAKGLGALAPALAVVLTLVGTVNYFRFDQYPTRTAAEWVGQNAPGARVMTMGLNRQVMRHYLPATELLPDGPLDPRRLRGGVLVVRSPFDLSRQDAGTLADFCRPPVSFPSSGELIYGYNVYVCD